MFFSLSTSVLILVAGSTVRASPVYLEARGAGVVVGQNGLLQELDAPASSSSQSSAVKTAAFTPAVITSSTASQWSWNPSSTTVKSSPTAIKAQTTGAAAKGPPAFTPLTQSSTKSNSVSAHSATSKPAAPTSTGAKGAGSSTFTVPISTPKASAKTSIAPHSATAPAKATVTPSAGASGSTASGSKCDGTNDGAVICSPDGTQFGLCDHGAVVMRAVSKGTACRNGAIDYIADVLGLALGQVKSYLDTADNATSAIQPASSSAIDAADCPAALLHLKDSIDKADSNSDNLRFVKGTEKTFVDDSDVELVRLPDGRTGFQVAHDCGTKSSGSKDKRQLNYIDICLLF